MNDSKEIKEVKVFTYPNCKITVSVPNLSSEERERRMKAIHKATEELLKTTI